MAFQIRMGKRTGLDEIWATFPYDSRVTEKLKTSVQGVRWNRKEAMWTAPLDLSTCRDVVSVAKAFSGGVKIEPELASWAKGERSRIQNMLRPDDLLSDRSKLLPVCRAKYPHIVEAMESRKPWQIPGAAFIAEQRNVIVADKPGLGKTLQVIAALMEIEVTGPILVVGPKTAISVTWPDEIQRWLGSDENVFSINGDLKPAERKQVAAAAKAKIDAGERVWVFTSPNYVRVKAELDDFGNYLKDEKGQKIVRTVGEAIPELFRVEFDAIIVDESQSVLACNTGNKKKWSAQRTGMGALSANPKAIRIAISGTPFHGRTEMIWGTLNWLQPKKYTSYWKWADRHYGVTDEFINSEDKVKVKGDIILDESRFFADLKPIMVRRTHEELRAQGYITGEKQYQGRPLDPADPNSPVAVWLPMTEKQAKQYKKVQDDAVIILEGLEEERDEIMVNGSLAELTRLKQIAGSALGFDVKPAMPSNKIDWTLNFLTERIAEGTKVVVASQFTALLKLLSAECDKLGIQHYTYVGGLKGSERQQIKHQFQSESGHLVILLNTASGGVSLTLDAADDVVQLDKTWIPDDQEQVENRAYGRERDHDVRIWNLASLGTIDEDIEILNAEREGQIFAVMDSARGINYVKALAYRTSERKAAA